MLLEDFKVAGFYKYVVYDFNDNVKTYYFKFECLTITGDIKGYYEIVDNSLRTHSFFPPLMNCFNKIDFSEIVNMLPDNHIDKIIYLRNEKIKILLNVKD